MVNVLVTGGAGFIGSHVVDELVKRKNKVYVLDNFSSGKLSNLNKKAKLIRGDIRDDLDSMFKGIRIDYIFHLAAQVSVRRSMDMPEVNEDINVRGSMNLIDFAVRRNVRKFIFSSSAAVYAPENDIPIKENAKLNPLSPYGQSKLAIERKLENLSDKLDYVILRYANVYGPRQDAAGEAGVIALFTNAVLKNEDLKIFGTGEQTRDFVFVKDVALANVQAMGMSGIYNVSTNRSTSVLYLANLLIRVGNSKSKIIGLPRITGEVMHSRSDNSRLLECGWKPQYSLDNSLSETFKWFRQDLMKRNRLMGKGRKRILELCAFSAGGCGVFARVKNEARILSDKGHEIAIFSSNREKGTDKIVPALDRLGNILIKRFPATKLGGESFMYWNFEKDALRFKPDVIFAHSYRHPHTFKALKVAKKLGCKVYLITHAPFARSSTRTHVQRAVVWFYDKVFARRYLNKFDKVVAISKWEVPYLIQAGVKEKNIEYIPNGIPDEFFSTKMKGKVENKILFFGRVSRIKRLESVIKSLPLVKDKSIKLEIVGPREEDYYSELKALVSKLGLQKRVMFTEAIYDVKKKIEKIDSAKYCVLASISEGMPQGLVEYLARGKLVFASNNPGNADIVQDDENGFLFAIDDSEELAAKLNATLDMSDKYKKTITGNAIKSVKDFAWSKVVGKIENLICTC
ncbi:MAG: NAD-dependent epimerase/dehydratase family protein [archaeon]